MRVFKTAVAACSLYAALSGHALAQQPQTPKAHVQQLIQQCVDLAEARDGTSLATHAVDADNTKRYVEGRPFELKVSLLGHGNTFYNLDCDVDADGMVSFRGYAEAGVPVE